MTYPNIKETMRNYFGIVLTDEQIKKYGNKHPVTKRDVKDDVCDTLDREILIDAIVQDVAGPEYHWPLNMDGLQYINQFTKAFLKGYKGKIEIVPEFWQI